MMEITGEQLEALFVDVLKAHKTKLAKLADLNRRDGTLGDPLEEMRQERAMGWAYRILARNDVAACIYDQDRETMRQAGLDETAIVRVAATLDWMHASDMARPSTWRLDEALKAVGAEMTSANVARGQPVYLRALGEALLQTEERHMGDPIDFGRLLGETGQTVSGTTTGAVSPPIEKVQKSGSISESDPVEQAVPPAINAGTKLDVIDRSAARASPTDGKSSAEFAKDEAAKPRSARPRGRPPSDQSRTKATPLGSPREIGAKLIAAKVADHRWGTKTAQQAGVTFDLFTRFLREEFGVQSLANLRQIHLDGFDSFLRQLFKSYGRSSKDRSRTISQLRAIGAQKPAEEVGLEGGTRNRHLSFLGQLLRCARASGVKLDPGLELTEFRAKKNTRARNQRPIPKLGVMTDFFFSPIYIGCKAWDDIHASGPYVFHRASYFGPMLAHYHGMRREEFCGLAVEDIIRDNGEHPYIHVNFSPPPLKWSALKYGFWSPKEDGHGETTQA